jgi:K+-sensing histidine kinase KdpD
MDGIVGTSGARRRARESGVARQLAEREQFDAAALAIAERVRSELSLEQTLQETAEELGFVTGASRCLIQLAPDEAGVCVMLEWDRGDTKPLGVQPPTPVARSVFESAEPLVVADVWAAEATDVTGYLRSVGAASAIAFPIRWQDGRVVGVVGFQDTTPRDWRADVLPLLQRLEGQLAAAFVQAELFERQRESLDELRDLARMREELIANVSHELRTPLTAVTGIVKTLRRTDVEIDEERRAQLLVILDEQADRLVDLAQDLLDFSRYRHGRQRLHLSRWSLEELVERALRELPLPAGRRVRLDLEAGDVEVDGNKLIQVLTNLVQNAIRHGRGDVRVGCRHDGDQVLITVTDEGRGLTAGREEELFQPFAYDSDRTDSTGLGLPIARAIVEAHGGSLLYHRPTSSASHRFEVKLPTPRRAASR